MLVQLIRLRYHRKATLAILSTEAMHSRAKTPVEALSVVVLKSVSMHLCLIRNAQWICELLLLLP